MGYYEVKLSYSYRKLTIHVEESRSLTCLLRGAWLGKSNSLYGCVPLIQLRFKDCCPCSLLVFLRNL